MSCLLAVPDRNASDFHGRTASPATHCTTAGTSLKDAGAARVEILFPRAQRLWSNQQRGREERPQLPAIARVFGQFSPVHE